MSLRTEQALVQALLDGNLQLDIVHENGNFSVWNGVEYVHENGTYLPQADRPYIENKNLSADTQPFSLNDSDDYLGTFQINLYYPSDTGGIAMKQKVETIIKDIFTIGKRLVYDGQKVIIESNRQNRLLIAGGFMTMVLRIDHRSFVSR